MIHHDRKQHDAYFYFSPVFNRRRYAPSEGRVLDIPPLGMTALTWGLFMGVSSNLRYQAVFGLERVVDKTVARRVPQVIDCLLSRCSKENISSERQFSSAWWMTPSPAACPICEAYR